MSVLDITDVLFWVCWAYLAVTVKNDSINSGSLLCLPACKKSNSFLTSIVRYQNDNAILPAYFGHAWPNPSKKIVWTYKKLWCLLSCKRSISSLTSFLRYCKGMDTSYFQYFKHARPHPSIMSAWISRKLLSLSAQKINFNLFFLEMLQRFYQLVTLGTLGIPDNAHQEQ